MELYLSNTYLFIDKKIGFRKMIQQDSIWFFILI
jgi:hypothetical protein